MADSNNGVPPSPSQRRKSFVEMLNPRAFSTTSSSFSTSPSNAVPAAPAVPGQRKSSMSIALGLSTGSGTQDSPFNAFARQRRASISTSSAGGSPEFRNSFDDNAVIEDDDKVPPMNSPPSPSFARRLSFGAQAMRDVRQAGTSPSNNAGEGFNWSDAMRDKNKRVSLSPTTPFAGGHSRSKSVNATMTEPPRDLVAPPSTATPAPLRSKKPDHLGERMLRGDFMMD